MSERTCHRCDAPLPARSEARGRPRKSCSDYCRNRWRYELRLERENPRPVSRDAAYLQWASKFGDREGAARKVARWQRLREEACRAT